MSQNYYIRRLMVIPSTRFFIPKVISVSWRMGNHSTSVAWPLHFVRAMFICPAENAIKVAAFVGSAHAVYTNLGQGLKCHITCAHYCLADVVQAVVAVKYDLFRGDRCNTFRVVGKTKKVLEIISKFYNYRCSEDLLDNEVGGTSRLHTLLLYQGCSVQGARLAGR